MMGNYHARCGAGEKPEVETPEAYLSLFGQIPKREFSKLIGFLVVALVAVGLVFNASGVKDVLLQLFNKIIGA